MPKDSEGRVYVTVLAVPLTDEMGLWCDRCFLPALRHAEMALEVDGSPLGVFPYTYCESGCDDGEITMEGLP